MSILCITYGKVFKQGDTVSITVDDTFDTILNIALRILSLSLFN